MRKAVFSLGELPYFAESHFFSGQTSAFCGKPFFLWADFRNLRFAFGLIYDLGVVWQNAKFPLSRKLERWYNMRSFMLMSKDGRVAECAFRRWFYLRFEVYLAKLPSFALQNLKDLHIVFWGLIHMLSVFVSTKSGTFRRISSIRRLDCCEKENSA